MSAFSITSETALEGSSTPTLVTFTISLEEPLTSIQTLKLAVVNASAELNKDFIAIPAANATITFNSGETVKEVTVTIVDDALNETDETFLLNVTIPKGTPLNLGVTDILVTGIGRITDTLRSAVTTTLVSTVENLFLTGSANINGTGNNGNNIIKGNSGQNNLDASGGDDTLDGGAGIDTLIGGTGNDFYIIDVSETVTEALSAGTDTIQSSVNLTLGANLENLIITGTALTGNGNTSDNYLTGNNLANNLNGSSGNDTLEGKGGADTLIGGDGDDTYTIDNLDTITEAVNGGEDTIQIKSSIDLSSAAFVNVENATIIGTGDNTGSGSSGSNKLTGNVNRNELTGGQGNDVLDGKAAADTLKGSQGDDRYILDTPLDVVIELANEGIDVIEAPFSYILGDNQERLVLTGTENLEAIGNALANSLVGNSGSNFLDGDLGSDLMAGGNGNDTYVVDNITDSVTEDNSNAAERDTILSSINYTLGNNLENLTLTGNTATTGAGNNFNNLLIGNDINNNLSGGTGNDTLDGGIGNDSLNGETNNDIYIVDNTGDQVTETSSLSTEKDLVKASVTYTLSVNVEDLELTGTANINGTGNILNNKITGNVGKNKLDGGSGNDSLDGGLEQDTLIGGGGDDSLNGGLDRDSLVGGIGNDKFIVDNFRDKVLENLDQGTDLVESSVTYALGDHVENLTLLGTGNINGTGNNLANIIQGNTGINTLDGDANNDSLKGGAGNDVLIGGSGNDSLYGETGSDIHIGGTGDDIYFVELSTDIIGEEENEGIDEVFSTAPLYTLSANVENLTLVIGNINGTGNDLNNRITGNTGINVIDGSTGSDTLIGSSSGDTYVVDSVGDVVNETITTTTEIDTVNSSISYTLGSNLEFLQLLGGDTLTGTGNDLNNLLVGNDGNNTLTDNIGNDTLDGGKGADILTAGSGNDTYVVDNIGDLVTESLDNGKDTVFSSITYTLTNNVENLTLTGVSNINGTGNSLNNLINGNKGNNILVGRLGDDTIIGGDGQDVLTGQGANDLLTGGNGNDQFNYNTGVAYSGADLGSDRISDFKANNNVDKIILGKTTFGLASNVGTGFSVASEFASVANDDTAKINTARIVYSTGTGNIFYNPNGNILGGESVVTTLTTKPSVIAADFVINA